MTVDAEALFADERAHLMGVAYRMLGTVSDAEDILQDVFEKWLQADRSDVLVPGAFLTTMTSRLCIDRLRSARHRRETYVGPWLPEPIRTSDDPAAIAELGESVTIGFLHLLEQLSATERAVYLLHEVFDYTFREIADIVDKSDANCRQIASRARSKLKATRPEPWEVSTADHENEVVAALLEAVASGDIDATMALLTDDVVHLSDGGEHRRAARHPIVGPHRVARLLVGLAKRLPDGPEADVAVELIRANGQPAFLIVVDGVPWTLVVVEIEPEGIRRLHAVVNPDKLHTVMAGQTLDS